MSHQMFAGEVMTREEFKNVMRFKHILEPQVARWGQDNRGDHTVQVCLFADYELRNMYLSTSDLSSLVSVDQAQSARVAQGWADALRDAIRKGDYHTR